MAGRSKLATMSMAGPLSASRWRGSRRQPRRGAAGRGGSILKRPRPAPMMVETAARLRVLVADDNPGVLRSVSRLLALEYDVVGLVSNGTDLIEAAHRLQPDIIVLDLSFTDIESLEACRLITQRDPRIKVVVFTVEEGAAVRQRSFEAGAVAFANKLTDDLLTEIKRLHDDER